MAGGIVGTTTNHPFSIITNGSAKMTILSNGAIGIGGNVGIGTANPENTGGWNRVLDIYGQNHSKTIVTTNSIQTGMWSHNSGSFGAMAGGMVGTSTNHPFSIITNGSAKMTILSNGAIGIGGNPSSDRLTIRDPNAATINFINGNGHEYILGNYKTSIWGAPNTFSLFDKTSDRYLMEFRQDGTYIHNRLFVGVGRGLIHKDHFGSYAEASSYDFNPHNVNTDDSFKGFIFENRNYESSGFYGDGDYAVIWSPGDYGYLLKVLDEDGMVLKWYLDGQGNAFTNSDKNRKENISKIDGSLNKIQNSLLLAVCISGSFENHTQVCSRKFCFSLI